MNEYTQFRTADMPETLDELNDTERYHECPNCHGVHHAVGCPVGHEEQFAPAPEPAAGHTPTPERICKCGHVESQHGEEDYSECAVHKCKCPRFRSAPKLASHSPLPWAWLPNEGQFIVDAKGNIVGEIPCQGCNPNDGRLIVETVNNLEHQREVIAGLVAGLTEIYNALPVTSTPEEFLKGHGNWGLTEQEHDIARFAAIALAAAAKES